MNACSKPRGRARWIWLLRKSLGITQAELAGMVGVSTRTVVRWEHNVHTPQPLAMRTLLQIQINTEDK